MNQIETINTLQPVYEDNLFLSRGEGDCKRICFAIRKADSETEYLVYFERSLTPKVRSADSLFSRYKVTAEEDDVCNFLEQLTNKFNLNMELKGIWNHIVEASEEKLEEDKIVDVKYANQYYYAVKHYTQSLFSYLLKKAYWKAMEINEGSLEEGPMYEKLIHFLMVLSMNRTMSFNMYKEQVNIEFPYNGIQSTVNV